MTRYSLPTEEQLEALSHFAKLNGRNWKARLSDLWTRAAADSISMACAIPTAQHGCANLHCCSNPDRPCVYASW
ncbi:MAG: hypothetical protein ACD_10C00408G0002 [uncultured bacterium]|nr:MAG: hypothetical protein ACD_10C00408G0002 [uncultured bacterium]